LSKAKYPKRLRIAIAWQHSQTDEWDTLDEYLDDDRFRIINIEHTESQGCCWARNLVQQLYKGEDYTLQLDSHHRFASDWDETLISMLLNLKSLGYEKPLITGYVPSYDPSNDPAGRVHELWKMNFDRFIPEGAMFFLPDVFISNYNDRPIRGRFYSAHFAFTLGVFSLEVQHNPEYYFHGEEISIAVRAFTHGYDIFHPNIVVCWHEYTRNGRVKQWDDDITWGFKNEHSHRLNRILFGMDEEEGEIDSKYGFGSQRTLHDYEKYAGISFKHRAVQQETLDHREPPNSLLPDDQWESSLLPIFKHCIDIGYDQIPETDYDFWCVVFKDEHDNDLYRKDADEEEINNIRNDPDSYCKVWRQFETKTKPKRWVVWPHSKSKGWCPQISGELNW
jgi:glycosyltransferase involved in cell wall biosynthesis